MQHIQQVQQPSPKQLVQQQYTIKAMIKKSTRTRISQNHHCAQTGVTVTVDTGTVVASVVAMTEYRLGNSKIKYTYLCYTEHTLQ